VIVIGGGLAGLSSAVALADHGCRVLLLEQRPFLGGRATSYVLPGGEHVDNCQHVTLGCCTNLDDFYRRAGAAGRIRFYDTLYFVDKRGRRGTIAPSFLPAPLHLAPSFAFLPIFTLSEKLEIAMGMRAVAREHARAAQPAGTMLEWLRDRGQTSRVIENFWRVVLVSALDEELDRTDAACGIQVFWTAFLASRRGFLVGIPSVPLAELYAGCRDAVERRGGEVRTRAVVRGIEIRDAAFSGVRLDDGAVLSADYCLASVPHTELLDLLPAELVERQPAFAGLRNLRVSPITGVHFWFDRPVMAEPFLTLLERTTQWIFNKSVLSGPRPEPGASPGEQYLQLVISASYGLVSRSRQEITELCLADVHDVLPASRDARLLKSTVIKETSATFSPAPGSDQWRPAQTSPVTNLFLAGDWTRTGWPATMEGAVRSGYLAAGAILAAAGRPARLLQPDLQVAPLARILSAL